MSQRKPLEHWPWIIAGGLLLAVVVSVAAPNFARQRCTARPMLSCINNLRQIDGAREQWALENQRAKGDVPTTNDLAIYIKGEFPKCPAGGSYTLGSGTNRPRCSITNHFLP